jgi:hypothetical protein
MGLSNLFDIVYSDESIKNELNEMINGIKIEKFMESHNDINNQFVLFACKNVVYNKTYNKLKLEFHNINETKINNSLVSKTLEKLQSIINESLDLSPENEEVYKIIDTTIDESYDTDDTDESYDTDIEIPDEVENNIKMILSKTECLQLHLFHRNYNDDTLKYITTFLLNNKFPIKDSLNMNHETFGEFDTDDDLDNYINLNYYYEKIYRDFNDLNNIYNYIENYDVIDNNLINNLSYVLSGFYFNYDDIRFQLVLKILILTHIGNYGGFSKFISYKHYVKDKSINNYLKYDADYKLTIFDNLVIDNLKIWCDICNDKIGLNNDDLYYHSNISGDLCDKCFNSKKMRFYEHIKYIKKRILLIGRIEVFKNELIKTRNFLKKRKYKIKKKNYYDLLQKMNKNLIENTSYSENECKICYTPLRDDIYVGSKCGHCFHRECIECCDKCQICREETLFIKLFL